VEDVTGILQMYSKPNSINGSELAAKLKSGEMWSPEERRFLTKAVGRHLMKTCTM